MTAATPTTASAYLRQRVEIAKEREEFEPPEVRLCVNCRELPRRTGKYCSELCGDLYNSEAMGTELREYQESV